ncbi:MAG: MBL fold metallo-hydrolase [Pelosinus sp.]|nr:MBL fold metallo-hydrolase [Pelosinus sp.]
MKIQLLRHATIRVNINGYNLLIDPMLSAQGTMSAVPNSPQPECNPLVELPENFTVANIDAMLLTHIHRDHLDDEAIRLLPKNLPVFCQPTDKEELSNYGFENVRPVDEKLEWKGIHFFRTGGHHGTGEIGKMMGKVSGYVLQAPGEPSLYIIGDTIWCAEVKEALEKYKPMVSVVFAGAAQFLQGEPITMTAHDVKEVCSSNLGMKVVAVHMEAFNHCLLTRRELRNFATKNSFSEQLYIPQDGEQLVFAAIER